MTDKPLDQTGRVIGVCRPNSNSIEIYTAYWNKASQHERQVLIFHELGHCVHLLDHKNTVDPASGWPASIMYPYILSGFQYESWYNYYNSELFNGSAVRTPAAEQRCEL